MEELPQRTEMSAHKSWYPPDGLSQKNAALNSARHFL